MPSSIILASQSPRRQQLMQWAEIAFDVMVRHTEEDFPASMPPEEVPVFIAEKKANAVAGYLQQTQPKKFADSTLVAADTVVVLGDEIIGKPLNREDAIRILMKLSGNIHRVITGVYICNPRVQLSFFDVTEVSFYPLEEQQVAHYVDIYKPFDKAGAYAIQEWIGVTGIQSIKGDFYNVMGLPIARVVKSLQQLKVI